MATHSPSRQGGHTIEVAAPPDAVHELIADIANWPRTFPATIHVDHAQKNEQDEYIRIWSVVDGVAERRTLRRILQPEQRRINFQQTAPVSPVASLGGAWIVEELPDGGSLVRLLHEYRAVDDDPRTLDRIGRDLDRDSRAELEALKRNVEAAHGARDLTFSFEDSVRVGGSGRDVFAFLNEAQLWAERLPHVAKVRLEEDGEGLQSLEMDTVARDGSTHTTKSFRVTFPYHAIAYKQVTLPALLSLHTGLWTISEDGAGGVLATSRHTVVIDPERIEGVLGAGAGAADAKAYVQGALSANSRATLAHAKDYAEKRS
ncbi:aromatase/cyclase [Streptomyces sp. HPF1205]|uniref:aromatase/cyclase n=1 Tax=Streptomyces sp. HPF1205 TaxID=2873262 RepID=UPI001CED1C03|nr:aromatase/cyclase [Streptomyces sp. HPF1205]